MEFTWPQLTAQLVEKHDLSSQATAWAMDQVMSGAADPVNLAGFLVALSAKGETGAELSGLAEAMIAHATPINLTADSIDIVGTGGDRLKTINISTLSALVLAAGGLAVIKHGNRAASSSCGSADLLEALGVNITLNPAQVQEVFQQLRIAFLFAPTFHPSMRFAGPTRRQLGIPTAFNLLGPLTNPAQPRFNLIGVYNEHKAPVMADVLASRDARALVVRCTNGMDELSTIAPNQIWEVADGNVHSYTFDAAAALGTTPANIKDLTGGDAAFNADVSRRLLSGELSGPVLDAVVLNAGAAWALKNTDFFGSEQALASAVARGAQWAREVISSGAASAYLEKWVTLTRNMGTATN